jgi:hypothetical protein
MMAPRRVCAGADSMLHPKRDILQTRLYVLEVTGVRIYEQMEGGCAPYQVIQISHR